MHRHLITGLWLAAFLFAVCTPLLRAEPPLPPKPARHFSDAAGIIPQEVGQRIDAKLQQFERETSNQVLVAIYPRLPEGTYLEDYTVKTAEAWGAGGKERDNGIILFVFVADRKMRIEVGYGLEGVVPDSIAKSIIENILKPQFRKGDYAAGVEQAVDAIFKATRGEYKGTGRTLGDAGDSEDTPFWLVFLLIPVLF
ncbi:MAG TPA: TPM domain-containing protein, partial [Prosthecobacter sp.]|nr:TPM domain-containing protein [Prosthecobacter sp.]